MLLKSIFCSVAVVLLLLISTQSELAAAVVCQCSATCSDGNVHSYLLPDNPEFFDGCHDSQCAVVCQGSSVCPGNGSPQANSAYCTNPPTTTKAPSSTTSSSSKTEKRNIALDVGVAVGILVTFIIVTVVALLIVQKYRVESVKYSVLNSTQPESPDDNMLQQRQDDGESAFKAVPVQVAIAF